MGTLSFTDDTVSAHLAFVDYWYGNRPHQTYWQQHSFKFTYQNATVSPAYLFQDWCWNNFYRLSGF
jgi:hypothetical protein